MAQSQQHHQQIHHFFPTPGEGSYLASNPAPMETNGTMLDARKLQCRPPKCQNQCVLFPGELRDRNPFHGFLSLLWHPVSMVVFIFTMGVWLFLYFLRDAPVVFLGYGVDERVILVVLSISTVVLLLLTHATVFLVELAVGLVVVALHGAFRRTNDLFSDEEQGVKSDVSVYLEETASASYSSPF